MGQIDTPSRGPPPSAGIFAVERHDKPCVVYATLLDGVRLKSGALLVKIGRTNQIGRRQRELNFGFPRELGIKWTVVRTWPFANGSAAHRAEQSILQSEARCGRSAGGEFIRIEPNGLARFLDGCDTSLRSCRGGGGQRDVVDASETSPSARHRVKRHG